MERWGGRKNLANPDSVAHLTPLVQKPRKVEPMILMALHRWSALTRPGHVLKFFPVDTRRPSWIVNTPTAHLFFSVAQPPAQLNKISATTAHDCQRRASTERMRRSSSCW